MANLIKINSNLERDSYKKLELMQGYTYNVQFNVTEDCKSVDLEGVTPRMELVRGNKTYIIQTENLKIEGNTVRVKIDKSFTSSEGKGKMQLILTRNDEVFGSWVIECDIKSRAISQEIEESTIITIIEELDTKIMEATKVKEETEELIKNGGSATKGDISKINSELQQKARKDEVFTMANMGRDIKEAMSGESVAIVGEGSVDEIALNADLNRALSSYQMEYLEVLTGYFDSTTNYNVIGSSSNYKSIKKSCITGEQYSCDCTVDTPSLSKVIFYNETGVVLSSLGKGENGVHKNFKFTVPKGVTYLSVTSKISMLSEPVLRKLKVNSTNELKEELDNLKDDVFNFSDIEFELQNGYYETVKTGFQANGQYSSIYQECKEKEKYSTSFILKDSVCAKVIFYNENNVRISWIGKGEVGDYKDFIFEAPKGAFYFSITSKGSIPTLQKFGNLARELNGKVSTLKDKIVKIDSKYPIYAYVNWNVYYIMWKYDETRDIVISLNTVGQSLLYQLSHFYTVSNTEKDCCGNFDLKQTQLKATSSDFIAPYKMLAKSNIDGDNPSEDKLRFTGGWHGFNGNQTGGTTGNKVSINVYVDGKKMGKANKTKVGGRKIEIVVVNNINASNTAKSDGTGRSVLQETVTYTFTEGKIGIDLKMEALEDITIKEYYGLQIEASGYKDEIIFVSDDTVSTDYNKYTYVGIKNEQICNTIISNGSDKSITGGIDDTFGLGRRKYVLDSSYTAWSAEYGKSYFYLIKDKDMNMNKGQIANWKGYYKLKSRVI